MNDLDDNLSAGIEDYLLSLADSLNMAQRQLNNNIVRDVNGSAVSYQLPKLDFEMKMSLSMQNAQTNQVGSTNALPGQVAGQAQQRPKLMAQTISQFNKSSESAVSVIRGAFIAVPINGGKPLPRIRTEISVVDDYTRQITVVLATDTGEAVPDVKVEFNIDYESMHMQPPAPGDPTDIGVREGVVTTNDHGIAINQLFVPPYMDRPVPLIIDAMGQTETIYF